MPETKNAVRDPNKKVVMNVPTNVGYQDVEYYCYTGKKFGGHYYRLPLKKWEGAPWSLHVAVWQDTRGLKLPPLHCIHHINEDPADHRPENLTCMTILDHNAHHVRVRAELNYFLKYSKQIPLFAL